MDVLKGHTNWNTPLVNPVVVECGCVVSVLSSTGSLCHCFSRLGIGFLHIAGEHHSCTLSRYMAVGKITLPPDQ